MYLALAHFPFLLVIFDLLYRAMCNSAFASSAQFLLGSAGKESDWVLPGQTELRQLLPGVLAGNDSVLMAELWDVDDWMIRWFYGR